MTMTCIIPLYHSHLKYPEKNVHDCQLDHIKYMMNNTVYISILMKLNSLNNLNIKASIHDHRKYEESKKIKSLDYDIVKDHMDDLKESINLCYKKGITGVDIPISYFRVCNKIPDNGPLIEVCESMLYFGGDNSNLVCFTKEIVQQLIFTLPKGENLVARMVNSLVLQVLHRIKTEPAYMHNGEYKAKIGHRFMSIFDACEEVNEKRNKPNFYTKEIFNNDVFPSIVPLSWAFDPTPTEFQNTDCEHCIERKYTSMVKNILDGKPIYISIKDYAKNCNEDDNYKKPLQECACCQKVQMTMYKCANCNTPFCSIECQKKMWSEHKEWCFLYRETLTRKVKTLKIPKFYNTKKT